MKNLRLLFLLAVVLLCAGLVSCGGGPEPTPKEPEQPAAEESAAATEPEAATPEETAPENASQKSADEMTPCKIVNVDEAICTNELADALSSILQSQGESEEAASMAGSTIAEAIQKAPLDKRNGFKMRGLESGKEFSFFFQKVNDTCTLQLFEKQGEDNFSIVTSRSLPNCACEE